MEDHCCARAWPSGYMSHEIAMCTAGTGHAAADFCAAVILCSRLQWCSKFILDQAVVEEQRPFR